MKKKLVFFLILIAVSMLSVFDKPIISYADTTYETQEDLEQDLSDKIDNQLGGLDFSSLDGILAELTQSQSEIFGKATFLEKLKSIINGDFSNSYDNFLQYIVNLLFDNILDYIPTLCMIVAISIVCSFTNGMTSDTSNKGISNLIYFVCFGVIVVIVFSSVKGLVSYTSNVITSIKSQMDIIFPILLTLVTSIGNVVTVSAFQPAIALLSAGIMQIFTSIMIPLFIFSIVFVVVGNLSPSIKLDKCSKFCLSVFKWIIGIVFTVFIAVLSVQGITAASIDGISIKTAKFALKSYIPILGGYLSDGLNLIVASSVLIKNAVGATGLLLLFATIIVPIVKIVVFSLSLKLVAAIVEPLSENKISNFLYGVSKCLSMLVTCLIAIGFMYLITVGLIMCMANVF